MFDVITGFLLTTHFSRERERRREEHRLPPEPVLRWNWRLLRRRDGQSR